MTKDPVIQTKNLTIGYQDTPIMNDMTFSVNRGDIFIIMGGSGCGKSTLLRTLTGLIPPLKGEASVFGTSLTTSSEAEQKKLMQRCGILYQSGALFSAMTLSENIALPLQLYTDYTPQMIQDMVSLKLALVGLSGYEELYPSEISGGMKKRAGLARALALDPEIVYFDEPSAGLDPISARRLDDLIVDINQNSGTTIVIITHELPSLLGIGTNSIFLDARTRRIGAMGCPAELLKNPPNESVYEFLTRGDLYDKKSE